ncbi:MAG TPA: hypothetical protein VIT92_05455 [Burkholderiaceae bacterium]
MPRISLVIAALLAGLPFAADAAPVLVQVGQAMERFALLKEGQHRYLRYIHDNGANIPIDIWTRTVRFEARPGETTKLLHIVQRWDGVGKPAPVKYLDSWFDPVTFQPLSHQRITEKDGTRVVEGFVFSADKVTGMQDLADNTQKALSVALTEPTFNFETDMEMLQTLPLAAGYEAQINFYHPGGGAPARYTFRVAGEETIAGPSGPVPCWVVTTDYNKPGGPIGKFYFAKGTQQFVRQESVGATGRIGYKTLID